jgi:hypothetical protein
MRTPRKRCVISGHVVLDVAALDVRVVLQLPSRGMKRIGQGHVDVLVAGFVLWIARYLDVMTGHGELDVDVEVISVPLVVVRQCDHDRAPLDPIELVLEASHPAMNRRFDGRTRGHPAKLDLEWNLHHSVAVQLASHTREEIEGAAKSS